MQNSRVDTLLDEADTLFERPGEDIEDGVRLGPECSSSLPVCQPQSVQMCTRLFWSTGNGLILLEGDC